MISLKFFSFFNFAFSLFIFTIGTNIYSLKSLISKFSIICIRLSKSYWLFCSSDISFLILFNCLFILIIYLFLIYKTYLINFSSLIGSSFFSHYSKLVFNCFNPFASFSLWPSILLSVVLPKRWDWWTFTCILSRSCRYYASWSNWFWSAPPASWRS